MILQEIGLPGTMSSTSLGSVPRPVAVIHTRGAKAPSQMFANAPQKAVEGQGSTGPGLVGVQIRCGVAEDKDDNPDDAGDVAWADCLRRENAVALGVCGRCRLVGEIGNGDPAAAGAFLMAHLFALRSVDDRDRTDRGADAESFRPLTGSSDCQPTSTISNNNFLPIPGSTFVAFVRPFVARYETPARRSSLFRPRGDK
jgi:hypothetical protein